MDNQEFKKKKSKSQTLNECSCTVFQQKLFMGLLFKDVCFQRDLQIKTPRENEEKL